MTPYEQFTWRGFMDIALNIGQQGDWDILYYAGPINEESEVHLAQVATRLRPKVIINFKRVEYVNSCGVRGWINFMRQLTGKTVIFEECTPEIVMQINMIPSFKAHATIKSVFGSFQCGDCGSQSTILFEEGKNMPEENSPINQPVCNKCGGTMEMDEIEDEFFAFKTAS
jgi:hypothetical protein